VPRPYTGGKFPQRVDVPLTEEQMEALRELAAELDRSLGQTARRFIIQGLKRHQERKVSTR
jgi:hypothetical protein